MSDTSTIAWIALIGVWLNSAAIIILASRFL